MVIDLSLFAIGSRFFGKKFLLFSIFASICFSISYRIFESIGFLIQNLTGNMLVSSIFAGIFVGVGVGIVLRAGGASGGEDVIALLGSKFTNHVYILSDWIILALSLIYLDYIQILFSIVAVTISGKFIEVMYEYKKEKGNDKCNNRKEKDSGYEKRNSLPVQI